MGISRALLLLLIAPVALAAAPDGADLYAKNCATCHEVLAPLQNKNAFKTMTPQYILHVLDNGAMRLQAAKLSKDERVALVEYLAGTQVNAIPDGGKCAGPPPAGFAGPAWNGWGSDLDNSRSQTAEAAGLDAGRVSGLKLKWAFGFPGDYSAYSQPAIAGGRVFVGSAGGRVYSIDAKTGCTYWSFDAGTGVRSAITVDPAAGIAYFGDVRANVYALDASTGRQIWKTQIEDYPTARVTGAPKIYEGRVYVPVASRDEWMSVDPRFACCKFRGSVVALDAKTGKQIWKTYTIAEPARPTSKTKAGTQLWGPSGVGVWTSPTIDTKRRVLYVGTGDSYSDPPTPLSDSILALDLATGKIVWSRQLTEGDVFNGNCLQPKPSTCPGTIGPDSDFGSSPILRILASGKRVLVAGQKSGVVHALDPDDKGKILWQTRVGKGGMLGGIQWGPAADRGSVYVALSDVGLIPAPEGVIPDPKLGGGLFAIQLATGEKFWSVLPPESGCKTPRCSPAQSAAVTVIPGVVFSGSLDGHLRAYDAKDGKILWDYDTAREFETVNGVPAKGGALDGPGPAIAGGLVVVNSGYGFFNGISGNVLLAFGVE